MEANLDREKVEAAVSLPKYADDGIYAEDHVKIETTGIGPEFVKLGYAGIVRVSDLRHSLTVLDAAQRVEIPF